MASPRLEAAAASTRKEADVRAARKPDTSIPTPWHADPDNRPNMDYNNHIVAANGNAICFMAWSGDNEDNEAHEKAAALLAAAPDLLASLIAVTDELERIAVPADAIGKVRHAARAAISKANGAP